MNEADSDFLSQVKRDTKADRGEIRSHLNRVKPEGYGRNSVATYYKYKYAIQLLPILDLLAKDKEPLEFRKEKFPNMAKATLYHRIATPWNYIIDHMDTEDRKYAILREETKIRVAETGIQILFKDSEELEKLTPDKVEEPSRQKEWRTQVNTFLENAAEHGKLHLKRLSLSDEEVIDLQNSLYPLDFVVAVVTNNQIKIVYVDKVDNDKEKEHTDEERKLV